MYCRSCGKEVPLHSAFCLHCGSKIAIQQAVSLPTKADSKMRKILALSALGVICFVALIYGLSSGTGQRQSEVPLPVSNPTATPSESSTIGEAAKPAAGRSVKAQSKNSAATRPATVSGSAQLNSAARPATAPAVETAAPVRLSPCSSPGGRRHNSPSITPYPTSTGRSGRKPIASGSRGRRSSGRSNGLMNECGS